MKNVRFIDDNDTIFLKLLIWFKELSKKRSTASRMTTNEDHSFLETVIAARDDSLKPLQLLVHETDEAVDGNLGEALSEIHGRVECEWAYVRVVYVYSCRTKSDAQVMEISHVLFAVLESW